MKGSETPTRASPVEIIANHATGLRFEDLPPLVVARGKQVVLDTLGTALGGYQTALGRLAADYAATRWPAADASIIADGRRCAVWGAAWANAVICKILGMDDSHRVCGHMAAELVPVALSLGEARHLSGRRVITALAAGYDVFGAIQPGVEKPQRERGLDHKGQAGTLASAVTAGVAMGLDATKMANALALSADMACGTEQYVWDAEKSDVKDLLAGYAARNGIEAASMADFGFRGPPGALDGPYGYFHAFGGGYDPSYLDGIGTRFILGEAAFKPYAGCRYVHAGVDAALALVAKGCPPPNEISAVAIRSYHDAITPAFRVNQRPANEGEASFSLPVAVAVGLVRHGWYREDIEHYNDPEIRRLWSIAAVELDEELEAEYPKKNGCVVHVTTKDGRHFTGRVDQAKGEPENMLTDEEFERKFRYLAGDLLPPARLERIIQMTLNLDRLDDVGDLVRATHAAAATIARR